MQNGGEKLKKVFSVATPVIYDDSLHITEVEHLVEYLQSLASFKAVLDLPVDKIREIITAHVVDGAIDLPKEYGTFACR
jgi:hypothetical protein